MTTKTVSSSQCEHNALIRRQFVKIESLETELALLRLERDSLQGENERLQFQLECALQTHNNHNNDDNHNSTDDRINNKREKRENGIELSQQLIDRRVDALERKYGGIVARQSAQTIQRAFRAYKLKKRFQSIAFEALKNVSKNHNKNQSKEQNRREEDNNQQSVVRENLTACVANQHESERKRKYRVALNLLNKKPEKGVAFLARHSFLDYSDNVEKNAANIARFLLTRKGVSKAVIGEYLSSNELVLKCFTRELDFSSLPIDCALRKFQTYFRFPGEAQKIERIVEAFAARYQECNQELQIQSDSLFILSFAIIMLNTDLHSPTNARNRMTPQQWINNLSRVFTENQFSLEFLTEIYLRIKTQELRTGADHVTQVAKVQQAIVSASRGQQIPNLVLESRRLVCYCRLYEVLNRKETRDRHQREVFLFNDLLLVTKLSARAKNQMPEYVFRQSLCLEGLLLSLFETHFHRFGIEIKDNNNKVLLVFNARNQLDQKRFAEDLQESILETNEMETQRQQMTKTSSLLALGSSQQQSTAEQREEQHNESQNRRKSSSGSLDSGLSLPSRDHSPQTNNSQKQS